MPKEKNFDELIEGVFNGDISIFNLPVELYAYTVTILDKMVFKGWGNVTASQSAKVNQFRHNIGMFSGAKTFQNVLDLSKAVYLPDGSKMPFADYKKLALKINNQYNLNWLKSEQNTVFAQSENARKWVKYEDERALFPNLKYITVGDSRVRHSHKELNGLIRPVNDPVWSRIMPQNDFGCRCIVVQTLESEITNKTKTKSKTSEIFSEFKKGDGFDFNPAKTGYIFKEKGKGKERYFKVPRAFKTEQENNFGFPSVQEVTNKHV